MTALGVEDRLAIEAGFITYCAAIDRRDDPAGAASFYTEDGVMDNSALGSPLVEGRAALTATISSMFDAMARLEHFLSNFLVTGHDGDVVQSQCYVVAHGQPNSGDAFSLRGMYRLESKRVAGEWKIARLTFQLFA